MIDYSKLPSRDILAIDVKSFYASVECVKRKLHPLHAYLVVADARNQGSVILASSPLMKSEFGIKTGSRVYQVPRDNRIIFAPPRMRLYLKVNKMIHEIFQKYVADEDLYTYSIDESFLDVTRSKQLFGDTRIIAKKIQAEIWQTLLLPTCIGIGDNPLLAKLCMDNDAKKRIEAIAEWRYSTIPNTVWNIPKLEDFWGIGSKTANKLRNMGIESVYELAHADISKLKMKFGVLGEELYYHANGVDYTIFSERGEYKSKSKSVGNGQMLHRDYRRAVEIEIVIREICDSVATRLRRQGVEASVIMLTITFSRDVLETGFSHQRMMPYTNSTKNISEVCLSIFRDYYVEWTPVRRIAISCSKLKEKSPLQFNLFERPERTIQNEKLDIIIDNIRSRYGFTSLIHASSLMQGGTAVKRSQLVGGHLG